uniref:Uncharacterized protein n=1 Tax=Chelonoidis abingdonii TaxID=106734 RepID=A0A8C0GA31_CHEAB
MEATRCLLQQSSLGSVRFIPRPAHLGAGAPQAQPMLLDQFILWAAVQTELEAGALLREVQALLRHTDGEGEVAAHLADDDSAADVAGLDLHLAAGSLLPPSGSCAVTERQWQVLCGRLINLLLCAALVTLKDQRDLQGRRKATRSAW